LRTISHEELKQKLDRQDNFRLVMALAEWAYQAKHIPDSPHFATMREALASLGKAETHLLLGALILVRLRSRDSFNEIGEILLGELLNGCNHIPKFLPFFGEMILDARRDLQESSPLHEPHLFQDPEPLCERFRTDMSH